MHGNRNSRRLIGSLQSLQTGEQRADVNHQHGEQAKPDSDVRCVLPASHG
jgi:hypothetical protein